MKSYICTDKCYHNGSLYRKGDMAVFGDDFPKDKKGNIRFFEPVETAPAVKEVKSSDKKVKVNGKETAE